MSSPVQTLFQSMRRRPLLVVGGLVVAAGIGYALAPASETPRAKQQNSDMSSQSRRVGARYTPSAAEWASLTIEPVNARAFRSEHITEGKIAVDEDHSTPVY